MKFPVYKPQLGGKEKQYVNECLDTTWISSRGEFVSRFEAKFTDYTGVGHAVTVCNGTVALHLALVALGIGPGDEVLIPSLTYIAPVNMILLTGATPVFVDSLPDTWNMDPQDAERKITGKTRAILAVHLYGQSCSMEAITEICRKHYLFLIEDCAEAFGTKYKNTHVGTFGDVSTFSFFGNKTITTGEGGMVCAKSIELQDRIYHLKTQAVSPAIEYFHDALGFNYRMTNICAAIGLAQIERADRVLNQKRQIAAWYEEELKNLPVVAHKEAEGTTHSFWMCSVLVQDPTLRDPLRDHLKFKHIETRPLFYPAHTMHHCRRDTNLPVAEDLSSRGLNLPSYPALAREDIKIICSEIETFFSKASR